MMGGNNFKFKKSIALLLSAFLIIMAGCGNGASSGSGSSSGATAGSSELTRAQFITMLGEAFGYQGCAAESIAFSDVKESDENFTAIQAAAEWGVVDAGGDFNPDKAATLEFALESAVRAIDTDDIARSGADIDTGNLPGFYVNNIAGIDISNLSSTIDSETADQILTYAKDYRNNLVLPQVAEIDFADGVIEDKGDIKLNADGQTGSFTFGDYKVGDIVYIDGGDEALARSIKITSVDGNNFTFTNATLEETLNNIHLSGTFDGAIIDVTTATSAGNASYGRELYSEISSYGMSYSSGMTEGFDDVEFLDMGIKSDIGSDHAMFTVPLAAQPPTSGSYMAHKDADGNNTSASYDYSGNAEFRFGIKNIKVTVDYEHDFLNVLGAKKVNFKLNYDTEVTFDAKGHVGTSIPLGDMVIKVWGPVNVKVSLVANIGADGKITISYTTQNCAHAEWKRGSGVSAGHDSTPHLTVDADGTLSAEATALAELRVGIWDAQYGLANVQVTSGIVAVAKVDADLLDDEPDCCDLLIYVPLRWGVNQKGCLITDINKDWKYSQTIWDSENSPVKMHFHFEDFVRTPNDECTRGGDKEVKTEDTDENGDPYDEYKLFEFVPIEFDFVELVSYTMFVDIGETGKIEIANIPEGYSENDLVYSSDDTSICTVSGGTVNGVGAGSTIVRIGTTDGAYEVTLAVTVRDDYSVEGGFTSL